MDWEQMADLRGELAAINRTLQRIAQALEAFNNAAIRGVKLDESDGHVEVFATTHEA